MRPRRTELEAGAVTSGLQQKHVVGIDHRRIGYVAMSRPHRAVIEAGQAALARVHIREAAKPDESVRIVEVDKLADHLHTEVFLAFDELALEEIDQHIASAWMERV